MRQTKQRTPMGAVTMILLVGSGSFPSNAHGEISFHIGSYGHGGHVGISYRHDGGYHHRSHHGHYGYYGSYRRYPSHYCHGSAGHHYGYRSYYYQYPYSSYLHHDSYLRTQAYVVYGREQPSSHTSVARYTTSGQGARVVYSEPQIVDKDEPVETTRVRTSRPANLVRPQQGWHHLANGSYDEALTHFGLEAQANPQKGGPKVGYALASASRGHLYRGIWSMRRAFRIDPDGAQDVRIDDQTRPQIETLIGQYEYPIKNTGTESNTMFMVAALRFLLRDLDEAQFAIDAAVKTGDLLVSTINLKLLIGRDHQLGINEQPPMQEEHLTQGQRTDKAKDDY